MVKQTSKFQKKIKILVFSHTSDFFGGAERSLLDTLDYWNEKYSISVEFILRQPVRGLGPQLDKRGWKYHTLDYTFWSHAVAPTKPHDIFDHAVKNAEAIFATEEIIKKSKPDVVLTNSVVAPWGALAAAFQQVPHVWCVREYGDLDHGRVFEIGQAATFQDVGQLSSLVVTNSQTLGEHVAQYVSAEKLATLYTPFPLKEIEAQLKEKTMSPFTHEGSLKLVLTGTLAASKGQLEALNAVGPLVKEGFNLEICFVGGSPTGEYMTELRQVMDEYGMRDRVHLVGHQANPLALVAISDVGIMTSRKEAFGRVTFEYMIAGKPVIGASSGATPELVEDGKSGFIYKQGDSKDLGRKIRKYLENPELVKAHGKAAATKAKAMRSGKYGADELFKRIQAVVMSHELPVQPPHYTHRVLEYLLIARDSSDVFRKTSLYHVIRWKLRRKARTAYHRVRTVVAKTVKK